MFTGGIVTAGLALAAQAMIEPKPATSAVLLEEVVVTGERVPRTLGQTASSVVVATAESLQARAAPDRIEQVLALVPNVQFGSGGDGPTIRGQDTTGVLRDLPAFLGGTRPRATLTIDGRPVSYNEYAFGVASIWDVERIEVFRSPQTTTQGRNSIAGGIFIETRDPGFEWEGVLRVVAGDYATRQVSGALSGPLAGEQLAFRLAGDVRRSRTSSTVVSSAAGPDPNRDEFETVRLKLLAEPRAMPDARFELTYSHVDSEMPQVEGIVQPFRGRSNPNATYGIFSVSVDSLTGVFDYRPESGFAITTTASFGDSTVTRFAPTGLGENRILGSDYSIESLIDWSPGGPFRLTGGVHYLGTSLDQTTDLSAALLGRGSFTDRQQSAGVFGETSLSLSPQLTFTAGLRYQRDRQQRRGGLAGAGTPITLDFDGEYDGWLPKATLACDLSDESRIGLSVQRAYNPGGVSINLARSAAVEFDPEMLWAYELFARTTLAGGALSVSANVFYYDMSDSQRSLNREFVVPGGQVARFQEVSNAPRARSHGLEAEARWRASRSITIGAALGLLNTRITATPAPTDPILGKQFQRSPRFSAAGSIDWTPAEALRLTAQLRHNSDYFSDDAQTAALRVGGSTTLDARASWQAGQVTVFGYVRNVLGEFYLTYLFPPSGSLATAGDPREMGLGLEARF